MARMTLYVAIFRNKWATQDNQHSNQTLMPESPERVAYTGDQAHVMNFTVPGIFIFRGVIIQKQHA